MVAGIKENLKQELALCLSDEVAQLVYGRYGHEAYTALTEKQLLAAIREMVVRTRNKMVTRHKLRKMVQSHDQPVQTYLSNLKATARMCEYKAKCEDEMCGKMVDFTDMMVLEQLSVGLADEDTQRKLFAKPEVTLADAEKLVIAEEIGKLSQEDSKSVSGISQYKKDQRLAATPGKRCKWCGEASSVQVKKSHRRKILKHMRFDTQSGKYVSSWSGKRMKSLPVELRVDKEGYQDLSGTCAPGKVDHRRVTKCSSIADTGASVCCSGSDVLQSLGVHKDDLLETEVNLYAADRKKLTVMGVLPVVIASKRVGSGDMAEVRELVYIVEELGRLYVSREALVALGSIPSCFPEVPGQEVSSMEYAEALVARITELETKAPC